MSYFSLVLGIAIVLALLCVVLVVLLLRAKSVATGKTAECAKAQELAQQNEIRYTSELKERALEVEHERELAEARIHEVLRQSERVQAEYDSLKLEATAGLQREAQSHGEIERLLAQNESVVARNSELKEECEKVVSELEVLRARAEKAEAELERARTQVESEKGYLQQLKQDFVQQKEALKTEFKSLSEGILKERQKEFAQTNSEGLKNVLNPLKEAFGAFKERVDIVHTEQTKGQGQLENELKTLKQMNSQLSERAENLTTALRNDKKKMGNWGELQLERLLENAGLDKHCYRREANFKTVEGANQRPDFIIDLPDNKCLIVDSKVSLNAYVDSVNAESEEQSLALLKEHTTNVRNHIKGLSEKSYDSLELLNSPDFVFMFMPNEAAYLAAFEEDASLFDFAYDKRIAVVTPNTLLPIMRTVNNLWRMEKQNKNTESLAKSAESLHKKLLTFLDRFEKVGAQLQTVQNTYAEAHKTLSTGKGNLLSLAERFEEQGVKVKRSIAESFKLEGE